jgi:hypothetical protein
LTFSRTPLEKDEPHIEAKGKVISAASDKCMIYINPDVLRFKFSKICESLKLSAADLKFYYKVEVLENKT